MHVIYKLFSLSSPYLDAGEPIPDLKKSLEEMAEGLAGRQYSEEQLIVRTARGKTGLTQSLFAELINTPVATVRDWEQGRFTPPGAAITLMRLIIRDPIHARFHQYETPRNQPDMLSFLVNQM